MYSNRIKNYFVLPFERIKRIDAISKDVNTQREKYKSKHTIETNIVYNEKMGLEDTLATYEKTRFFPPTELYIKPINTPKVLINKRPINYHEVYQLKENILGNNIDEGI